MREIMYAITGITGKVGGALAEALLAAGRPVRAVVRDAAKGVAWAARGCEVAIAEMEDPAALAAAFSGAEAVFILPPSEFDPEPGCPEARRVIDAVVAALLAAQPARVLCLSTIGADATHDNLLSQRTLLEQALSALPMPVTFLRPAWFIDNAAWDVASARDEGVIHSFLAPPDKRFPMVATQDIGATAASLIPQNWTGQRVVELEGPAQVSPNDLALSFAEALGRPVRVEIVPRDSWEALFRSQGAKHPTPRMRMLDGFNEGWIAFRDRGHGALKGNTSLAAAVEALVARYVAEVR
jgi:NAD(P)H dehydrogenase (quinone)